MTSGSMGPQPVDGGVSLSTIESWLSRILGGTMPGPAELEMVLRSACADLDAHSVSLRVGSAVTTVVTGSGAVTGAVETVLNIDDRRSLVIYLDHELLASEQQRARAWGGLIALIQAQADAPRGDDVRVMRRIRSALAVISAVPDAAQYIVSTALRHVGGDVAWYAARTSHGLAIQADSGFEDPEFARHWLLNAGEGVGGRVFTHGTTVMSNDYLHDSRRVKPLAGLADREGIRAVLVSPVPRASGGIGGALYLVRRQAHSFHEHDVQLLTILGEELGECLDRIAREQGAQHRLTTLLVEQEVWGKLRALVRSGFDAAIAGESLEAMLAAIASLPGLGLTMHEGSRAEPFVCGDPSGPDTSSVVVTGPEDAVARIAVRSDGLTGDQLAFVHDSLEQLVRLHWVSLKGRFSERRNFVARIVTREVTSPHETLAEGLALGIDLTRTRAVASFTPRTLSDTGGSGSPVDLVERVVSETFETAICARVGSGICALIEVDPRREAMLGERAADVVRDSRLHPYSVVAGVGGLCEGPADYPRSWREARLAARFAEHRASPAAVHIADVGAFALFARADLDEELIGNVDLLLGPLRSLDDTMVHTLDVYLHAGMSVEETARRLNIHPNTLRYRLRRLQEQLGIDLREGDQRFLVELGLRARHLLTGG